jgi:hypothetical protein
MPPENAEHNHGGRGWLVAAGAAYALWLGLLVVLSVIQKTS